MGEGEELGKETLAGAGMREEGFAQEAFDVTRNGKDDREGQLQPGGYLGSRPSESKNGCLGMMVVEILVDDEKEAHFDHFSS